MLTKKLTLSLIASFAFSYDLNSILDMALNNNYKVKSYTHKVLSKKYAIEKAKSLYYPSINLSTSVTYEKYKEKYPNGYTSKIDEKSRYYGISLKQVIFDKSIFPNVNDAELKRDIAKIEKEGFILNLYQRVLSTYFQVLTSKENLEYTRLKKENYANILKEIEEKEKYNFATKTDVIQAKSNYVSAENEYIKAKVLYENYLTNLKILLLTSKDIEVNGKIKDNIGDIISQNISLKDKEKIVNNPSLKQNALYIKVAKNSINANKAAYYPTVYLNSTYYQDNHDDTATDQRHFKVSLNLNWNIYSGGKTKNSIQEAKELYLAAVNDYNYQKTTLELDFNENWTNLQNSLKILNSDKEKINKTKEYLLRAEESLKYKTISLTDYYSAQNDYYQALIDFNRDKLNAILYYIKILGDTNEIKEKIKVLDSFIN